MKPKDNPLLRGWQGEKTDGGVRPGDHDIDRAVIHPLKPLVVEFEPVIKTGTGEHKNCGESEHDEREYGDGRGEGADDKHDGADCDENCTDKMGDGVEGFADFCQAASILLLCCSNRLRFRTVTIHLGREIV